MRGADLEVNREVIHMTISFLSKSREASLT